MSSFDIKDKDTNKLNEIKKKLMESEKQLFLQISELESLNSHIERVKQAEIEGEESDEEEKEEKDGTMFCVTCGQEIFNKSSLKHMDKCFNKVEARSTLISFHKQSLDKNAPKLLCDYFDKNQKTYCKRLRIMCEEHNKPPKISDTEFCGFKYEINKEGEGSFCKIRKKKCRQHFGWEKLRKGCIDMNRLYHDAKVRAAKISRRDFMGYLLNKTIRHV